MSGEARPLPCDSSEVGAATKPRRAVCSPSVTEDEDHDHTEAEGESAYLPDNSDTRLGMDIDGHAWGQVVAGFREIQASRMAKYTSGERPKKPRFSAAKASKKYAKAKDVERHCLREFETLTTFWGSFVIPEKSPAGEWRNPEDLARCFQRAHKAMLRCLRRKVKDHRHAGVWLRAARQTGFTHLHPGVWVEGDELSEDDFHSVVDSFCRNAAKAMDGLTEEELREANPYEDAIKVNHVTPEDIGTPDHPDADTEADQRRGETTALPREIGGNIDALGTDFDIRATEDDTDGDAPSPEVMHAALCFETDMRIWQPFGAFTEYAETEKARREARGTPGEYQSAYLPDNSDTPETTSTPSDTDKDTPTSPETPDQPTHDTEDGTPAPTLPQRDTAGTTDTPTEPRISPQTRATGKTAHTRRPRKRTAIRRSRAYDAKNSVRCRGQTGVG